MTLYMVFQCAALALNACHLVQSPYVSQADCERAARAMTAQLPNKGMWYQCFSREVETWEPTER